MKSKRIFISGREPKKYEVMNGCFQVINGPQKFNRILYGVLCKNGSQRFRAIAGDLPEVLIYLPGDGGRAFFGFANKNSSKWLAEMAWIRTQYGEGGIKYDLKDPLLKDGVLSLSIMPLADTAGVIIKIIAEKVPEGSKFIFAFGGASGMQDSRGMDAGYTPESKVAFHENFCAGNLITTGDKQFILQKDAGSEARVFGRLSYGGNFKKVDAGCILGNPIIMDDEMNSELQIAYHTAVIHPENFEDYIYLALSDPGKELTVGEARQVYENSKSYYAGIANRVNVKTPGELFEAAVKSACIASEAFWVPPVYVHGAWSWDIPILGWRSMYGPAAFGWHDRVMAEAGFFTGLQLNESMQPSDRESVTMLNSSRFATDAAYFGREKKVAEVEPLGRPDPDPGYHLARQSSRSIFVSPGMIPYMPDKTKKVMYDMAQVFMDQVLYEYYWTGDVGFAKRIFPALIRHLEWEKRCFDTDNDGLYENYANFWASDGIFASGAGCALASAYNYRANYVAAELAIKLGESPKPFLEAACKIKQAIQDLLWNQDNGYLAECKDTYGEKLLHPLLSIPTIVHVVDSGVLNDFQIYQLLKYTEHVLERVPVEGCDGELVWNSNWVPYLWSVRDIDYADVFHTSLGYYKIGRVGEAYKLLIGAVTDSACNHVSPGAFFCVYEGKSIDFADTVSMFDRTMVEGLFGISPRMHEEKVVITPGFPGDWKTAAITTPDFSYQYSFTDDLENISGRSRRQCRKVIRLMAKRNSVIKARVNGVEASPVKEPGIGHSYIVFELGSGFEFSVQVEYGPESFANLNHPKIVVAGGDIGIHHPKLKIIEVKDPQTVLTEYHTSVSSGFTGNIAEKLGHHLFFLLVKDNEMKYWYPVNIEIRSIIEIEEQFLSADALQFSFILRNNMRTGLILDVVYDQQTRRITIGSYSQSETIVFDITNHIELTPGTNIFEISISGYINQTLKVSIEDWELGNRIPRIRNGMADKIKLVPIETFFNDQVSEIFKHEYLSPRSPYCSLQVPVHLYPSDWCATSPDGIEMINDKLLRSSVNEEGIFLSAAGIPFLQESKMEIHNVAFVSKWDNFPSQIIIPLQGTGKKIYFFLTGYTNQMQCGVINGTIDLIYHNGSKSSLTLIPPDNFRSIEKGPKTERPQDAFCYGKKFLYRVKLGAGESAVHKVVFGTEQCYSAEGPYGQILDLILEPKELECLQVNAVANDVIIGLLGVTIV